MNSKRVPCKPHDILAVKNVLLQSVHCVTNSVTCSPVQCSQQAAAAAAVQSVSQTHNKQWLPVRPRMDSPKLIKKFELHLILAGKGGGSKLKWTKEEWSAPLNKSWRSRGEADVYLHSFFNLGAPAALAPGDRPGTHRTESWVGPGPIWTDVENVAHTGIRSPDRLTRSESLSRPTTELHKKMSSVGTPSRIPNTQWYRLRWERVRFEFRSRHRSWLSSVG